MIGQLKFFRGEREVTVTLGDDLLWSGDDDKVVDEVALGFLVEPVDGLPNRLIGRHALYQAAARLSGTVDVPKLDRREPTIIG